MQVAAFGTSATRSLLFLGHIQSVSVSTWVADSPTAVKLWQASLSTAHNSSGAAVRVGECLSAKHKGLVQVLTPYKHPYDGLLLTEACVVVLQPQPRTQCDADDAVMQVPSLSSSQAF